MQKPILQKKNVYKSGVNGSASNRDFGGFSCDGGLPVTTKVQVDPFKTEQDISSCSGTEIMADLATDENLKPSTPGINC